jgi:hypothetical protein
MLIVNLIRYKRIGQPQLLTGSLMSKAEILTSIIKGVLCVTVAFLMLYYSYIENYYYRMIVICTIAAFGAYQVFPIINFLCFKKEMGMYEKGVFTYKGVLNYGAMKEYAISENKNYERNGQNMTVIFKPNMKLLGHFNHLDIRSDQVNQVKTYLENKHQELKATKKEYKQLKKTVKKMSEVIKKNQ